MTDHLASARKRKAALDMWALGYPAAYIIENVGYSKSGLLQMVFRARNAGDVRAVNRNPRKPEIDFVKRIVDDGRMFSSPKYD